jgi:hypothetical protein
VEIIVQLSLLAAIALGVHRIARAFESIVELLKK